MTIATNETPSNGAERSVTGAQRAADAVHFLLLARSFLGALALLVARVEDLDLLQFLESLGEMPLRLVELAAQFLGGAAEIVAPLAGSPRIGGIGEVPDIVDADTILLELNLAIEVGRHTVELRHHRFDLRDAAPLLVDLEPLEAEERVTGFHAQRATGFGLAFGCLHRDNCRELRITLRYCG
jgi:hypothetical protein